jgi:hypothetical protein
MKNLFVIVSSAILIVSCKNQSVSEWQTVVLKQENQALTNLNLGDSTEDQGDGTAYEAPIKDTTGKIVGEVIGWMVTTDIMDGDSTNSIQITERIGSANFNFGNENEILVQGGSSFKRGETQLEIGVPQKRAIVGGTGIYKGVSGEVTTTRNQDGSYTHVLDMKLDN